MERTRCGYRSVCAAEGNQQFREVFIADMIVITLYQSLFEAFPGYGDDHAGAKLHVVEAVSSGLPAEFSITDARTHEFTQLSTGP